MILLDPQPKNAFKYTSHQVAIPSFDLGVINHFLESWTSPDIALLQWNDTFDEIGKKNRSGLPPRTPLFY